MNYKKILINTSIIVSVIAIFSLRLSHEYKRTRNSPLNKLIHEMDLPISDIYGRSLNGKQLQDKNIYIQFTNSDNRNDIDLLDKVSIDWGDDYAVLSFTDDPVVFLSNINNRRLLCPVISDVNNRFISAYKSSYRASSFYIYNNNKKLEYSGLCDLGYQYGIQILLKRIYTGQQALIDSFVPVGGYLKSYDWFKELEKEICQEDSQINALVILINFYSPSCLSGAIVDKVIELKLGDREQLLPIKIFFSRDYSKEDLENLRLQIGQNAPFEIADDVLCDKWESLKTTYLSSELNNIVFIVSLAGQIEQVAWELDPRYKELFDKFTAPFLEK